MKIETILGDHAGSFIRASTAKIVEINRRYSKPTITMTKSVKFALLMLQLYLFLLVILLGYKFYTIIRGG